MFLNNFKCLVTWEYLEAIPALYFSISAVGVPLLIAFCSVRLLITKNGSFDAVTLVTGAQKEYCLHFVFQHGSDSLVIE